MDGWTNHDWLIDWLDEHVEKYNVKNVRLGIGDAVGQKQAPGLEHIDTPMMGYQVFRSKLLRMDQQKLNQS